MGMGGMGGGMGQPGFDASAAFKNEREAMGFCKHVSVTEQHERALLGDSYPDISYVAEMDLIAGKQFGGN
jgi:hypothetical protein